MSASMKSIIVGLVMGVFLYYGGTAQACEMTAQQFSDLPDEQRWEIVLSGGHIPTPPPGYKYSIDDWTLIPITFHSTGV